MMDTIFPLYTKARRHRNLVTAVPPDFGFSARSVLIATRSTHLNLPALKGGDSGGTTMAASRVERPSE